MGVTNSLHLEIRQEKNISSKKNVVRIDASSMLIQVDSRLANKELMVDMVGLFLHSVDV